MGKKIKHQERFPVVIRLPISNGSIPDILCEIKIAITFECQADSNKSSEQNICLENYSKFNTSYCFSLSHRTAGYTISIVEQNCHHQHKVLKFGDMATNLVHKTEFSSKTSNEWLGWPHLSPVLKYIVRCCRFLIINKMTSLKIGNKLKGEEGTKINSIITVCLLSCL